MHQPAVKGEDDGMRVVNSRGLALFLFATTDIALEKGPRVPTTKVISSTFSSLRLHDRAFGLELDWMQASFTAQSEGT